MADRGGFGTAALPCCTKEDVEAGSAGPACRPAGLSTPWLRLAQSRRGESVRPKSCEQSIPTGWGTPLEDVLEGYLYGVKQVEVFHLDCGWAGALGGQRLKLVRLAARPPSEKPSPSARRSRIVPQPQKVTGRLIGAVLDMVGRPEMGDSHPSPTQQNERSLRDYAHLIAPP